MALSDRDRAILDLERSWWAEPSTKQATIRERVGVSPTRYYELLGELLELPEAEAYDPLVVRRLRRLRALRRRERFEGRPAGGRRIR